MSRIHKCTLLFLGLLLGVLLFIDLNRVPPVWYDEGWALSLARNWVKLGHYGQLLSGKPVPQSILNTGFPVIAPIALSFRIFGVGIWQGRLPGIFFTLGALGLMYYLASYLYNKAVATGTLVILLLMSDLYPGFVLSPIIIGRQALGEMPALFYILAGYVVFLLAWRRPWLMPVAACCWGLALLTKPQVFPFLVGSLLIPLLLAAFNRCWGSARLLTLGLAGSLIAAGLLGWLQSVFLSGQTLSSAPAHSVYDVLYDTYSFFTYVVVLVMPLRSQALRVIVVFGLPTMLGLGYVAREFIRKYDKAVLDDGLEMARLALWVLVSSWVLWYALLSIGWSRYLFPALFLGGVFVAGSIYDLTVGFDLSATIKRDSWNLAHGRLNVQNIGAVLAIVLMCIRIPTTLGILYYNYTVIADDSVLKVAEFLNTETAPDALVETYDSEIFFCLERDYHYPPDQVQTQLNRYYILGQAATIVYDPLNADPDYLVVGPQGKLWHLYDSVLENGAFRLVMDNNRYAVYERVR